MDDGNLGVLAGRFIHMEILVHPPGNFRPEKLFAALAADAGRYVLENQMFPPAPVIPFDRFFYDLSLTIYTDGILMCHSDNLPAPARIPPMRRFRDINRNDHNPISLLAAYDMDKTPIRISGNQATVTTRIIRVILNYFT